MAKSDKKLRTFCPVKGRQCVDCDQQAAIACIRGTVLLVDALETTSNLVGKVVAASTASGKPIRFTRKDK